MAAKIIPAIPTALKAVSNKPISFTTNVLVVGGAYAGLSAVNTFVSQVKSKCEQLGLTHINGNNNFSITMVEPRSGLLNVLGMPRCIVDEQFSKSQYVPFEHLSGLKFDSVISNYDEVLAKFAESRKQSENSKIGLDVQFVHGKVTYLDYSKAQYCLVGSDEKKVIDFDYVILASGRNREWPTTPEAYTFESFLEEMTTSKKLIDDSNIISVIGAGAVGVELAGDIKYYHPHKIVNLIHPHRLFPPEPLNDDFKVLVRSSLEKSGVNVKVDTRIKGSNKTGDLETTTGEIIKSDLNIWCNHHTNNTSFLSSEIKRNFVTDKNNIQINEYLQLHNQTQTVENFFVLGDLVDLPVIKSAGWALYHGRQVANNLSSLVLEGKFVEPHPDINQMPRGMVLVAGNGDIICDLAGDVALNVETYVQEYKDYCLGKIRATLNC